MDSLIVVSCVAILGLFAAEWILRGLRKILPGIVLLLLSGCVLHANELPDMPTPKPEAVKSAPASHPFWDRTNKIEASAIVVLVIVDNWQTCENLERGGRENILTQSCPENIAITAGVNAATIGLAWILHRTGHHRLERLPMLWKAGDSVGGIVFSKVHGGL